MAALAPRAPAQAAYPEHDVAPAAAGSNTGPSTIGSPAQHTPPQSVGSSSVSPSSSGPTSPHVAHAVIPSRKSLDQQQRPVQIGRPKASAGFVPAALRPTERPVKPVRRSNAHRPSQSRSGPPTPPQSLHGSTDSLADVHASSRNSSNSSSTTTLTKTISQTSAVRLTPLDTSNARSNSSRTTSVLHSPTASLSSLSLTGLAAAASAAPHPTKAHWKPDAMAPTCDAPACPIIFSTFVRRHHCRRCGGVFCYRHANRQVPLDVEARMVATPALSTTDSSSVPGTPRFGTAASVTPDTTVSWAAESATSADGANSGEDGVQMRNDVGLWRACDGCHAEWLNWTEGLREAAENAVAGGDFGSRMHLPVGLGVPGPERKSSAVGSIAGSVPRDWSWSTF